MNERNILGPAALSLILCVGSGSACLSKKNSPAAPVPNALQNNADGIEVGNPVSGDNDTVTACSASLKNDKAKGKTKTPDTCDEASEEATPDILDGAALYKKLCANCHGTAAATDIKDTSAEGIRAAILSIGAMKRIPASEAEVAAISQDLQNP